MIFRRKSKEEKEIEREIRYRKAINAIKNYISKLEILQRRIFEQGKQAAKIGDDKFVRRQASKYLVLEERIKKAQRLLLLMEEAKLQKELVKITGDFITFAKDISQAVAEGPAVKDIAKMQVEFEKAMGKAEAIDQALTVAIDVASEGILSGEFTEDKIDAVTKMIEGEALEEEKELDERISKGVKEIEEMMRKG